MYRYIWFPKIVYSLPLVMSQTSPQYMEYNASPNLTEAPPASFIDEIGKSVTNVCLFVAILKCTQQV